MTAIKHTLQREVFLPRERLVAVVHVTKAGKKKKESFLCAAVTTEKPIQAMIHQVKKSDRGDTFKKKLSWALRELKVLDAKTDNNRDTAEFDLQFEKTFKWVASSSKEKQAFVQCLWTLSQRYLVQRPEFVNIPSGLLDDASEKTEVNQTVQQAEDLALAGDSDYHALSTKEESDLEGLMSQCEFAISNAEAFSDQLSKDLSGLDGANIHSIMGSEDQVLELMVLIDQGLQETLKIEERLDDYAQKLQSVKDLMETMKDKDMLIQVRNSNHHKLLDDLDSMVSQLDLDHNHMKALLDGDLFKPQGIRDCTAAAKALQRCLSAQIHSSLSKMSAVQEQQKRFNKLKATFSKRLAHHLNNLFIHQGNELGETLSRYGQELKLPQHASSHRDLLPYADLMCWLKQADPDSFNKLVKVYTGSLKKLYDREVREFLESAKQKLAPLRVDRKGTLPGQKSGTPQGGSSSSLNKPFDSHSLKSASQTTLDSDSQHGSNPDVTGRTKLDQMLEHVLSELGPVCLAEQDFCVRFFSLAADEDDVDVAGVTQAAEPGDDADGPWQPQKSASPKQRKINEEVRKMMMGLFPTLETEVNGFIVFGDKMDSFNSLYMLVRMSQHVINAEDTGSFLSKTFGNCLVHIKRNFDKFIQVQIDAIQESRLSKKAKVGIIPFVHQFEHFAVQAESIFRGSDRRTDLDKAYARLVSTVFEAIARIASESQKTPSQVVIFENNHHMFAVLSKLKIGSLEVQKREAKQKYQDYLHSYVKFYLGHPMEKLHVFFEGIEGKVAAGVKEDEVSYQLRYSKQELRKLIKEYPGKEVKKSLDHLYRKVEKHLSEEENLLQVVWHSMQEEFLKQYSHFEQLTAKCYPGAGISLEFTMKDLLGYFSDIAQSH